MKTDVKTITPDATAQEAASEMVKYGIGGLIVVKNKRMKGIVTERDMLKKVVVEAKDSSKILIKSLMVRKVIMIDPNASLSDAVEVMNHHKIKKLPVLDKSTLVGIITITDIISYEPKLVEEISKLFVFRKKSPVAG